MVPFRFAQLTARGVSVSPVDFLVTDLHFDNALHQLFFDSGDGGVGGIQTPPVCVSNDGKNTTKFIPTFPSSCPL
jgi:hypothetical protein